MWAYRNAADDIEGNHSKTKQKISEKNCTLTINLFKLNGKTRVLTAMTNCEFPN